MAQEKSTRETRPSALRAGNFFQILEQRLATFVKFKHADGKRERASPPPRP